MDSQLFHNPGELSLGQFDIRRDGLVLVQDDTLETAVIISLFTDRRARPDDELPGLEDSRRGWWGDALSETQGDEIGSWLWLLYREKNTNETLNRAREYCMDALAWLLEDRIADRVQVSTWYMDPESSGLMEIEVIIVKRNGSQERYNLLWKRLFPNYSEPSEFTAQQYLLDEDGNRLRTEANEGLLLE